MSLSLALASIRHGFTYSYIGGKERTKDGLGIVVDGKEEVYESINPWDFLAVYEKERISTLFNNYQFKAAKELSDYVCNKTTKYKTLYKKIGLIIESFYKWDLFRHSDALKMFIRADVDSLQYEYDDRWIKDFTKEVLKAIERLKELIKDAGKPTMSMICDLFSNAERRFQEGKIDDAILRLYRAVEMIAQMRLLEGYEIDTSDVKPELIPESLRERFISRHRDFADNKIKIPQNDAFLLLKELGDTVGNTFMENEKKFKALQSSRNYSYLAHVFESSSENTYRSFREFILSLRIIETSDIIEFPKFI